MPRKGTLIDSWVCTGALTLRPEQAADSYLSSGGTDSSGESGSVELNKRRSGLYSGLLSLV